MRGAAQRDESSPQDGGPRGRVLVVDDEANMRTVLCALLERDGLETAEAASGAQALEMLRAAPFAAVLSDLRMPDVDGLELVVRAGEEFPGLPVVLLTAHGTVETAVQALRKGAFDFLTKPFDRDEVRAVVQKAVATGVHALSEAGPAAAEGRFHMIGASAGMQEVYRLIERVAGHDTAVVILGETGTGKELVARAIHEQSRRRLQPFIKVNCAAIPPSLAESELFGHEKGAFSGAVVSRPGRFELADGGTLFLDEVGEMPLEVQPKFLRALQGEVERVGGASPRKVDVRVVAATNVDLAKAVAEKRFREDLYFRLKVLPIRLPALRERREDIPLLVSRFLAHAARKLGRRLSGLSPALLQALQSHPFPGNVRELENLIERMAILADAEILDLRDLPPEYTGGASVAAPLAYSPPPLYPPPPPQAPGAAAVEATAAAGGLKEEVRLAVEAVERNAILRALESTGWNVTRAAERLGLSRKGLQLKMRHYHLRRGRPGGGGPAWEDETPEEEETAGGEGDAAEGTAGGDQLQ